MNGATKPVANKVAALRKAAFMLFNSKNALGGLFPTTACATGLDAPKAITATAHKLARLIYVMLTHGTVYVDAGQDLYEERYLSSYTTPEKKDS